MSKIKPLSEKLMIGYEWICKDIEKREKKKEKVFQSKTETDEYEFYDQAIQFIAQNTDNRKDSIIFSPDSTGKAAWEVAGLFFIIYQSFIIPFRLCFESDATGGWLVVETLIDICFMVDILVQFNTGFYRKGSLIFSRK